MHEVMNDFENVESSMLRVRANLRVLLDDQSTLVVASALNAAADALIRIRQYLEGRIGDPERVFPLIDFVDEVTSTLLPLVARRKLVAPTMGSQR